MVSPISNSVMLHDPNHSHASPPPRRHRRRARGSWGCINMGQYRRGCSIGVGVVSAYNPLLTLLPGIVLISKFKFQKSYLRSASSLDPTSKISSFACQTISSWFLRLLIPVLFIQVSAILVSYILRPFSLNNLILGDPEI